MAESKMLDLHDTSFEYRKKLFMRKLHKKLVNNQIQNKSFFDSHGIANQNNPSSSYIVLLESKRSLRHELDAKKSTESMYNRFDSSASLNYVSKEKLLKYRENTNSSFSNVSNASNFESKAARIRDKANTSGLSISNVSNESLNDKNEPYTPLKRDSIKTSLSSKTPKNLSVILEKKNKSSPLVRSIQNQENTNEENMSYTKLSNMTLGESKKFSNTNMHATSVIVETKNAESLTDAIEPVSFSENQFKKNFKYLHRNKNLAKLKDFVENRENSSKVTSHPKSLEEDFSDESINFHADLKEKRTYTGKKQRFKKWARLMVCMSKVLIIYKQKQELNCLFVQKFSEVEEVHSDKRNEELLFDKAYFRKPKELTMYDEAKKMLQLNPRDRTEEMIKTIIISLNFAVPEFSDFPIFMQKQIAKLAVFVEFEPGRVIIRQGDPPHYYYMTISGTALVINSRKSANSDELIHTPIATIKRGDCFGDISIINNTNRNATITVKGSQPLALLLIDKDNYFAIQSPIVSRAEKHKAELDFFKTKVKLLSNLNYPFDELNSLNQNNNAYCSIYYRQGTVISRDSKKDDWLYIVKAGSCRVFKRLRFDQTSYENYQNSLNEKISKKVFLDKINYLGNNSTTKSQYSVNKKDNSNLPPLFSKVETKGPLFSKNKSLCTYLEMKRLEEGDVFGLHDIILDEGNDSFILGSDGVECILINRVYFLKFLYPEIKLKLKFMLSPFPDDSYFFTKYFHSFEWSNYTHNEKNKAQLFRKIKNK